MIEWGDEPATEKQKRYLTKLGKEYSPLITKGDASKLIGAAKEEKLPIKSEEQKRFEATHWKQEEEKRQLQNEAEERESWLEDWRDLCNDYRGNFDCKIMSKKLFKNAVSSLEASGMTREQIENSPQSVIEKALEIDPNLLRASAKRQSHTKTGARKVKETSGGRLYKIIWVVIIIYFVLLLVLLFFYFPQIFTLT